MCWYNFKYYYISDLLRHLTPGVYKPLIYKQFLYMNNQVSNFIITNLFVNGLFDIFYE